MIIVNISYAGEEANTLRKTIWFLIFGITLWIGWVHSVKADNHHSMNDLNILVVFSSKNNEYDDHQRMLDMLLGHYTHNIRFVPSSSVQKRDIEQIDCLVYYGQEKELLPKSFLEMIATYDQKFIAIGHNVDQLESHFDFLTQIPSDVIVDRARLNTDSIKELSFTSQYMLNMEVVKKERVDIVISGKKDHREYPLLLKKGRNYYFASDFLKHSFAILFGEALLNIFQEDTDLMKHPGYIRLEDIHPLVDPDKLMEIAQVLVEKEIPYMIAVIPIYTNPDTKKQYRFSDSPKLLKVLRFMQDNGGSVVLHGYTHQFRLSETGEGFEFWDVEYNMPIYHGPEDKVIILEEKDFDRLGEYEQYVKEQQDFERKYIKDRLTAGIHELVNYGLYPLAFEAPHYTMSQHGYKVASGFFSTYVGQVQLSDEDWEIMTTAPYITKPTFLHGMNLLPETIGYVEPDDPFAIEKMLDKASDYKFVSNGIISGFYHPYLGVDRFIELLENLEQIPNIEWIDLKQIDNEVQTDLVVLKSHNGEVSVDIHHIKLLMSSINFFYFHLKNIISKILWCIAGIGILAILNFTYHIFRNHHGKHRIIRGDSIG